MSSKPLEEAVDRVERALLRIERAVERGPMKEDGGSADSLRARVADAIGELDNIIREAERG